VEHVVSGQATRFASLEELLAFIARVLAQGQASWGNDECCTPSFVLSKSDDARETRLERKEVVALECRRTLIRQARNPEGEK
jgi:hypothetical protein